MKTSLWQLALRRLPTRNWASQSCLFTPRKQTLNTAPVGGSGSMSRRKHVPDAKVTGPVLCDYPHISRQYRYTFPSLSRFYKVRWLRLYARSIFRAFIHHSPGRRFETLATSPRPESAHKCGYKRAQNENLEMHRNHLILPA